MNENIAVYKNKTVIFHQGDIENWMFDILDGKIGIYLNYGTPEEKKLLELLPGQFFGEMGLIEHMPRSATAVALENNTTLQKIGETEFQTYFSDKTDKLMDIMQYMSCRIRELTEDYLEACKAIHETVESEEDEEKKVTFREKFKKFINDRFILFSMDKYDSDTNFQPYIIGRHWDYSYYKMSFDNTKKY